MNDSKLRGSNREWRSRLLEGKSVVVPPAAAVADKWASPSRFLLPFPLLGCLSISLSIFTDFFNLHYLILCVVFLKGWYSQWWRRESIARLCQQYQLRRMMLPLRDPSGRSWVGKTKKKKSQNRVILLLIILFFEIKKKFLLLVPVESILGTKYRHSHHNLSFAYLHSKHAHLNYFIFLSLLVHVVLMF